MHDDEPSTTVNSNTPRSSTLVGKTTRRSTAPSQHGEDLESDISGDESTQSTVTRLDPIFRHAQWSPDGTTVFATKDDNTIDTFILPQDLLSEPYPHILAPYTTHKTPGPINSTAIYPFYQLNEPSSALFLASTAALPIRLLSPFSPGIVASYPLINPTTEAYIAPHSLIFGTTPDSSSHFYAGSDCQISIFDVHRNGEAPIEQFRTIPSRRKKIVGGGVGMKGIVSALGMSCEGILAAGTFTRWVGLYDAEGKGGTIGVFQLGKGADDSADVGSGSGLTQVIWSNCGRYLCTVERFSDGIAVWDVRGTKQRLAWLSGREARTMQRLDVDLIGNEVWAGGNDGKIRCWEGIGMKEGCIGPDWEFDGHKSAVTSAVMHPCATVIATCSGHWDPRTDLKDNFSDSDSSGEDQLSDGAVERIEQDSNSGQDRSLKVWTIGR